MPDLPSNAIGFDMGTFHDIEHDDALFGSIEYGGRTYIMYGTVNNKYKQSYIDSCIGYIIQNEHSSSVIDSDNTNRRIYTTQEDQIREYPQGLRPLISYLQYPAGSLMAF